MQLLIIWLGSNCKRVSSVFNLFVWFVFENVVCDALHLARLESQVSFSTLRDQRAAIRLPTFR